MGQQPVAGRTGLLIGKAVGQHVPRYPNEGPVRVGGAGEDDRRVGGQRPFQLAHFVRDG